MAIHGIIGRKVGMTQVFEADGTAVPVTVVQAGPFRAAAVGLRPVQTLIRMSTPAGMFSFWSASIVLPVASVM